MLNVNPKTRHIVYATSASGEAIKIMADIKDSLGQVVAVLQPKDEEVVSLTLGEAEAALVALRVGFVPGSLQHETELDLTDSEIAETQILQTTPENDSWVFKVSHHALQKPEEVPGATIAGCRHIAESIRHSTIFGQFYDQLRAGPESTDWKAILGSKPKRMPNPGITPVFTASGSHVVAAQVAGLPLSWLEVERLSQWGVYHKVHALFGERRWVTVDRSGSVSLYVFSDDENFI